MIISKRFASTGLLSCAMMLILTSLARAATLEASDPTAAYVTDQPATTAPGAKEVAREVLRLQQELGGSIVTDFSEPKHPSSNPWSPPPTVPTIPITHPYPNLGKRQPTPVDALRETAWRLDQSAYLLESLDLYSQADALRTTATRLRQDARKIKSEPKPGESAATTN